jgi:hypothetical protein
LQIEQVEIDEPSWLNYKSKTWLLQSVRLLLIVMFALQFRGDQSQWHCD